jgi:hypothetical protein
MKLILFKNGETDAQPIESIAVKNADDHEGRALIFYLASGDMAVLKLETAAEVTHVLDSLKG